MPPKRKPPAKKGAKKRCQHRIEPRYFCVDCGMEFEHPEESDERIISSGDVDRAADDEDARRGK